MQRALPILALATLIGCATETTSSELGTGAASERADESDYIVRVITTPEFEEYRALREVPDSGSKTARDIDNHLSDDDARLHTGDGDAVSQAFFGTLVASDRAAVALDSKALVIYLLDDRIIRFEPPRLSQRTITVPELSSGIGRISGDPLLIQQYWAAYIHKAMVRAELGTDPEVRHADALLEMTYLAAVHYSEIEAQDPAWITQQFRDFMAWQMFRATQAVADAGRFERDGDLTVLEARAAELRELAAGLSPEAAALVRDGLHLPRAASHDPGRVIY